MLWDWLIILGGVAYMLTLFVLSAQRQKRLREQRAAFNKFMADHLSRDEGNDKTGDAIRREVIALVLESGNNVRACVSDDGNRVIYSQYDAQGQIIPGTTKSVKLKNEVPRSN